MCWQCDHPEATQEDYLDLLRMKISYFGYAIQYIESEDLPLAYTVGLHWRGLPELLVTGLGPRESRRVLNAVTDDVLSGWRPVPSQRFDIGYEGLYEVVEVDHPDVHLWYTVKVCGADIRALQLVWADDRGRWPWDRGWDDGRRRQPVYGVRKRLCA